VNNLPSTRRRWRATATTTIARPPDQVWEFIRPAETAPLLQPEVRRAFHVPGTPSGVGEQQAAVIEGPDGTQLAVIHEITELRPGEYAETRSVTWPPSRQTFRLEPAPGGTTLTYTTEVSGARWWQPRTLVHKAVVASAQRYVDAVKRVMESEPPV